MRTEGRASDLIAHLPLDRTCLLVVGFSGIMRQHKAGGWSGAALVRWIILWPTSYRIAVDGV